MAVRSRIAPTLMTSMGAKDCNEANNPFPLPDRAVRPARTRQIQRIEIVVEILATSEKRIPKIPRKKKEERFARSTCRCSFGGIARFCFVQGTFAHQVG